jgi:hypothetical protein
LNITVPKTINCELYPMTDRENPDIEHLRIFDRRIDESRQQSTLDVLRGSVKRHDEFANDDDDEFQISRLDGSKFGIFKVWAPNIISQLEGTKNHQDDLAWAEFHRKNPLSAYECLESWRAFSEIYDRRLQMVFASRQLPEEPIDRAVELFARLDVAFAFGAPFYNIEALVADHREDQTKSPIGQQDNFGGGGVLDGVAMLLPSALADHVAKTSGEWGVTNWNDLRDRIGLMKDDFLLDRQTDQSEQYKILARIAEIASVSIEDVLFAANALQSIPTNVGGKSGDLDPAVARKKITALIEQPISLSSPVIGKDINALIRFRNWTPATKNDTNFLGEGWAYDAVCTTADELVSTVVKDSDTLLKPDAAAHFEDFVSPQLDGIDAASARGRLMLQMLLDDDFNEATIEKLHQELPIISEEIIEQLRLTVEQELFLDFTDSAPTYLVGGKAFGLRRAIELFGDQHVHWGKIVTTEAVQQWLYADNEISEQVTALKDATDIDEALGIASHIQGLIRSSAPSNGIIEAIRNFIPEGSKIALRSSSFDEDVAVIGPAPGIYESVIDCPTDDFGAVDRALKEVVCSFFSDKAISYRFTKGLRHEPLFAVLVQEFIRSPGGTVFKDENGIRLNIASRPDKINDANDKTIEEFHIESGNDHVPSAFLSSEQIDRIIHFIDKAYDLYGPSDIEYIVHPVSHEVKILQMRSLHRPDGGAHDRLNGEMPTRLVAVNDLSSLPDITTIAEPINLVIDTSINLEAFQGVLFRWIVKHSDTIKAITTKVKLPETCHFVNIVKSFGIAVYYAENE